MSANDVAAWGALVALVVSIATLSLTLWFNRRIKTVEVQNAFHERFDRLQEARSSILLGAHSMTDATLDHVAKIYFDRFWSLQFDQYVAWKRGLVDNGVFRFWAFARWKQFSDSSGDYWCLGTRGVSSSFAEVVREWNCEPSSGEGRASLVHGFIDLFEGISHAEKSEDVMFQLKKHRPTIIWRL